MAVQTNGGSVVEQDTTPVSAWFLPVPVAWVIPGAGHFLLKKTGRGALILPPSF